MYFLYRRKKIEKLLNCFRLNDVIWCERDLERYKILAELLLKDENVIFKYNFKLEIKDDFF